MAKIDAILEPVRPERRFSPAKVDFTAPVEQGIAEWNGAIPQEPKFRVESNLSPCTLTVDRMQWIRVVLELLKNAQSATGSLPRINPRRSTSERRA